MIFYDLSPDFDQFEHIDYGNGTDWESIKCPKYDEHQRAGKRIGTLKIEINIEKVGDFLWTFLGELIITDRVLKMFRENRIIGYEIEPVDIKKSKIKLPYKLWEVRVVGKGGEADRKSGIHLKNICKYCGVKSYIYPGGYSSYQKGPIFVNENNWDGSDIFRLETPGMILVREKVKDVVIKNKLTGVRFIPSHEL